MKNSILFIAIQISVFLFFPVLLLAQNDTIPKDTTKNVMKSNAQLYYSQTLSGSSLTEYIDKEYPNSIPIPGTNIRLAIGGYVKTDFIVDLDYVGDRSEFVTGTIGLDGSPESKLGGQTTFHAKESRLSFDFRGKSKSNIPMRAYIEFDFFGTENPYDYTPHLRIATITVGKLTIGQNWITLMDLNALPTTIDFEFGDALVFKRAVQIRYERSAGKHFKWAAAIEGPASSIDNPYELDGQAMLYLPSITGRIIWNHSLGHIQLAAQGLPHRFVSDSLGTSTAMGGGIHFSGALKFAKYDRFMWGIAYGNGWGQNIAAVAGPGADAVINSNGTLTTMTVFNFYLGVEHYWLSNLASTLSVNWAELLSPVNRTSDEQELGATVHANIRWGVFKRFSVGVEYMAGKQRIVDGTEGFGQRIQFGARLNFTD
ncbi:MAG: DcaP family trimeric outer membrane transporter [Bacteroidales bacterium]|nr:DcaP family trimeric outer membrane transporter [Bacteroidales bacterium]